MVIQASFLLIQHLIHPRGQGRMGNMHKKVFLFLLLTALLIFGVFKMTSHNDKKIRKFNDEVKVGYHLFSEKNKKAITLSKLDKNELLQFVTMNMDALSKSGSIENVEKNSQNVILELHTPKLPLMPFQRGYLTYTYIIKNKFNNGDGVYGEFSSEINRKDNEAPWSYSNMDVGLNVLLSTNFLPEDCKALGLEFKREFFMSDLVKNTVTSDWTPDRNREEFISSNNGIFAFYEFSTLRNSVPLTLVFGVLEDGYNGKEKFPKNWVVLYMKRNDAPVFSMPGE